MNRNQNIFFYFLFYFYINHFIIDLSCIKINYKMYEKLETYLSRERLNKYLELADGNKEKAIKLYELNIIFSHSFYVILQFIEIGLRNKINKSLIKCFGDEWYLNNELLFGENKEKGISTIEKINKTIEKIKERKIEKKKESIITNGDIVSWLDFGFWTNIFCGNYANTIWSQCLKYEFKEFKRKELHSKLNKIRILRNRIFHYEPIINSQSINMKDNINLLFYFVEYLYCDISKYIYNLSDFKSFLSRCMKLIKK